MIRNFIRRAFSSIASFGRSVFSSQWITGVDIPKPTTRDFMDSYEKSNLVRKALGKVANRCGTINLELYKIAAGSVTEIEQHELLDLLKNPNPHMSGSDLFEITAIHEVCTGSAYWWKAKNLNGKVEQLWILRPDYITPEIKDNVLIGYRYTAGIEQKIFPLDEIIHFKYANPLSMYSGSGYMLGLMQAVISDIFAQRWNAKFFFNSARPDGILSTEKQMTESQREEMGKAWNRKFGGERAQSIAVMSSGLHYEIVGNTHKDMDFSALRTMTQDDVLSTIGVPKSILGITEQVTRANAETGVYVFLSETIEPKFRKWVEKLNKSLVQDFDKTIILDFEDPTPEDEEALDTHHSVALNKWMTVNEIRDDRGMEPVEGGDVLYIPLGVIPIGESSMSSDSNNVDNSSKGYIAMKSKGSYSKKQKKMDRIYKDALRGNKVLQMTEAIYKDVRESVAKKIEKEIKSHEKKWTLSQKKALWRIFDARLTKYEIAWKAMQETLFEGQKKRIKAQLEDSDISKSINGVKRASVDDFVDWEKEAEVFSKKAKPLILEIIKEAGEFAMNQVGRYDFDPSDTKTAEWILMKAMKFAVDVNETTKNKLKLSLAEGLLLGEGIPDLAKRVDDVMDGRILSSAETIARTETLSSSNAGTLFGYEQTGIIQKKEWLATMDGKTRDAHMTADGQTVGIDESFKVDGEGLQYPGDPSGSASNIINCRCTLLPVISE